MFDPLAVQRPAIIATAPPPATAAGPVTRVEARRLILIVLAALIVRIAALVAFDRTASGDAAGYLEMARTAAEASVMRDGDGNAALLAPGYPLLLAGAFHLFGSGLGVARGVNLVLGVVTVLLAWATARRVSGRPAAALLAAAGTALLVPAIVATGVPTRENLSAALLLLFVYAVSGLIATRRAGRLAALAGIVFAAALLTDAAALPVAAAFVVAIARRRDGPALLLAFTAAVLLVLAPWLARNERVVGRAVLGTGTGLALYLGNNPYADGRADGIADTPLGPYWETFRKLNGEARRSDELTGLALAHVAAHPGETLLLDLRKAVLFWAPDLPDPDDPKPDPTLAAAKWAGAAELAMILALAVAALVGWRRWPAPLRLAALTILGIWLSDVVGAVPRDAAAPVLPLLLTIAAWPLAGGLARRRRHRPA